MYDFVKTMYSWGIEIDSYLELGAITEEEYKQEIIEGNVIVAMLKDDPVAYAIKKNDSVIEYYISWGFEDSELKESLLSFAV